MTPAARLALTYQSAPRHVRAAIVRYVVARGMFREFNAAREEIES